MAGKQGNHIPAFLDQNLVQFGSLKLGMLAQGKYRDLTPEEVHRLMTSSGAETKKKW